MRVAVYDTYVTKNNGEIMHFDILVPENVAFEKVLEFGKAYLKGTGQDGQPLSARECRFCHTELPTPEAGESIRDRGYYIIEMEGCR